MTCFETQAHLLQHLLGFLCESLKLTAVDIPETDGRQTPGLRWSSRETEFETEKPLRLWRNAK